MTVPKLDIPHIVHGPNGDGIGRGPGKDGDVIEKGKKKGNKPGNGAGEESAEGITISLDLEEVLQFMQNELKLPDMKPKPNETFEEEEIRYTSISMTGPESLRHNRRTMLQAMKRQAACGNADKLFVIPGFAQPVRMICPINSDRRYRQYRVIKKPSSNAVIFFARDGSGSMDDTRCGVVSDMAWWIDIWIRRFYKRVERCYIWHDTDAMEVDENKFYRHRYGGGTKCSSALQLIDKQLESRFPPNKWNFYIFYFTDGDNWGEDNSTFVKIIKERFTPEIVNFVGIAQILPWGGGSDTVKEYVDTHLGKVKNVRTVEVTNPSEDQRDAEVKEAIFKLLGGTRKASDQGNSEEAMGIGAPQTP